MATRKVTVTLPVEQLDRIEELVSAGHSVGVSGFVQEAVRTALDDAAGWGVMLAQALEESGGPLSSEERAWADIILIGAPRQDRAGA